jgi:aspartyl-tRNA(Asn)/glutamyl-tRNA(Gln) amidotransferase subunit C
VSVATRAAIVAAVRLARLELSADALDRLAAQVADILDHVEELAAVSLEGAEAIGGIADWAAPRRADEPAADPLHGPLAALAPAWQDGFFTVPRLASMEAPADDAS